MAPEKQRLKVLITVKTYPVPSEKYDELVCTAGVTETGDFIRLYPINFRELPFSQQFRKYQWIEVDVEKHTGWDSRKESHRPDPDTLKVLGEPIPTKNGDWSERAQFALAKKAKSLEDLKDMQARDKTSLGVFKPKRVTAVVVSPDEAEWKPKFLQALKQARLFETRTKTLEPPRKVPFKFQYVFECDDARCRGHQMMIEDWEVGALFWKMVDEGQTPDQAAEKVRQKFFDDLCGPDKDTHFYVGTLAAHQTTWVVIGVFYPKRSPPTLFSV